MDFLMAPRPARPSKDTSVTSISDDFFQVVQDYAASRGVPLRETYDEAVSAMVNRIRGGEDVQFLATVPGVPFKPRRIRMTPEIFDSMTEVCADRRVHQSVFFLRALRDYLAAQGIPTPE
jgi:hypothetical protein